MSGNAREYQREYQRRRRAEDPEFAERGRQVCRDNHKKNKEERNKKSRKYYADNVDKCRGYSRKYAKAHTEERKIYMKKYGPEYKKNNRGKTRAWSAAFWRRRKERVLAHYSDGSLSCKCCGETHIEFLTLDHVNGDGNRHRKELNGRNIYEWVEKNKYPPGFQVLCMNCNFAIGLFGKCPHQTLLLSEVVNA